jgi:predicted membrane protein (TIGR00267 family)
LDIAAGVVDGILNALILAAGHLYAHAGVSSLSLALRVGAAASLTTLFVFFVAHYAELRAELVRAEKELNLLAHGSLAASRLGQQALRKAAAGAVVAALCGLVGAAVPLSLGAFLPGPSWLVLAVTIAILGLVGGFLVRSFHGQPLLWSAFLIVGGSAVTYIGVCLDLVG